MQSSRNTSLDAIAVHLNARKVATVDDAQWRQAQARLILERNSYKDQPRR